MNKLVWVGRITSVDVVPDADRLESAEVVCGAGGKWRGVVVKGTFVVGSMCAVFLQDSILPKTEQFAFMEKHHYRVKMARFRGAPSECLIIPYVGDEPIGTDITGLYGVLKYEKPLPVGCDALGNFPVFIPKTDEPNFQSDPELVKALKGKAWYATEKVDGTSCTIFKHEGHFGVCSRNLEMQRNEKSAFWHLALSYGLEEKLPEGYAVQMEVAGPGIQKNSLGLKQVSGFVFNVWNISEKRYLGFHESRDFCAKLDLPTVRLIPHSGDGFDMTDDELRSFAEGCYQNGKQREGVVIRSEQEELVGLTKVRLSFKVLNLLYKD